MQLTAKDLKKFGSSQRVRRVGTLFFGPDPQAKQAGGAVSRKFTLEQGFFIGLGLQALDSGIPSHFLVEIKETIKPWLKERDFLPLYNGGLKKELPAYPIHVNNVFMGGIESLNIQVKIYQKEDKEKVKGPFEIIRIFSKSKLSGTESLGKFKGDEIVRYTKMTGIIAGGLTSGYVLKKIVELNLWNIFKQLKETL